MVESMTGAEGAVSPAGEELWVVMPVYNEEEALPGVLAEWLPVLRRTVGAPFKLCVLNDGSKDGTLGVLEGLARANPEIVVIDKTNSGHGQTCVYGYRQALTAGAPWILQIDSDGQCDASFFPALWAAQHRSPVVYGYRRRREDGFARFLISRVLSAVIFATARVWVRDANVPYRLMAAATLRDVVDAVPSDFKLANVLMSVFHQAHYGIHWCDITFRQRAGGQASVKTAAFAREGLRLRAQLAAVSRTAGARGRLKAAPVGPEQF